MDGCPITSILFIIIPNCFNIYVDEIVPVRMYLCNYDLTPTYENVNNKFSVKYYLSLVLVD